MNSQVLEQGVNDIHDYISTYLYAKYTSSDGVNIVDQLTQDDLYDMPNGQVRNFLSVLSGRVTTLFVNDVNAQNAVQSQKQFLTIVIVLLGILLSLGAVGPIAVYVILLKRRMVRIENIPLQVLTIATGMTVVETALSLLIIKFVADRKAVDQQNIIDISVQLPHSQLLWDSSLRQIYYNTISNSTTRQQMIDNDPALSGCANPEETDVTGGTIEDVVNTCGQLQPQLTNDYLARLLSYIQDFYTHKQDVLDVLQNLDESGNMTQLVSAQQTMSQLVRKGSAADPPSDVQLVINSVIPLFGPFSQFESAQLTGTPYSSTYAASSNACIDQCLGDNSCAMASFDSLAQDADTNCKLYNTTDSTVYVTSAIPSMQSYVKGNVPFYIQGPAIAGTSNGNEAYADGRACMRACSLSAQCTLCYNDGAGTAAFQSMSIPGADVPTVPATVGTEQGIYAYKNTGTGTSNAQLPSRTTYLATRISEIYLTHNVNPSDVSQSILNQLAQTNALSATDTQTVTAILTAAESAYADTRRGSRYYIDDLTFLGNVTAMTKRDFISNVLVPLKQVEQSGKTLRKRLQRLSVLSQLSWSVVKRSADAIAVDVILLAVLWSAFHTWRTSAAGLMASKQNKTMYWLQLAIVLGGVVFGVTLMLTWLQKLQVSNAAVQTAQYNSGLALTTAASDMRAYLVSNQNTISSILGASATINPLTGDLLLGGAPVYLNDPKLQAQVDLASIGDTKFAFMSRIRHFVVDMDRQLNDCQDLLQLKPVVQFPWSEILLLVTLGLILVACWMYSKRYLQPSAVLDTLRRLLKRKADGDYDVTVDSTPDFAMQVGSMLMMLAAVVVLTAACIRSAQGYTVVSSCKQQNPSS